MIRGSLRLFSVAGIPLYVHWTFFLLLAFIAYSRMREGREAVILSVLMVLALFGCVTLHELGHALMARRFGIKTEDITLLPIGGVARLRKMPEKPGQELLVALAGPAVNVVIAAIIFAALRSLPQAWDLPIIAGSDFFVTLMVINIWLVLFNMLPAFPMDGGRVLRAVLAMFMDRVKATRVAAGIGQIMAFVFAAWALGLFAGFGIPGNPLLLIIAFFVYIGAAGEAQAVETAELFRGARVRDAMVTRFRTLSSDMDLGRAAMELLAGSQQDFPVVDDGRVLGVLTRNNLLQALARQDGAARVGTVMETACHFLDEDTLLTDAMETMRSSGCPALPVLRAGQLVGLLTSENASEYMMIRSALRTRANA